MMLARWIVFALALLALAGCGGGAGSSTGASVPGERTSSSAHGPVAHPSPAQTRAWRGTGQRACRGMDPLEAALHFRAAARRAGAHRRFLILITEPTPAVERSPGYPRLVAALYATTLPEPQRALAAAGCAEELAAHR